MVTQEGTVNFHFDDNEDELRKSSKKMVTVLIFDLLIVLY